MKELRCTKCSKLLLKASKEYETTLATTQCDIEIQCTRHTCKASNHYKAK